VAIPVWVASVATGFAALGIYEFRPGAAAQPPRELSTRTEQPRLLVFLHPECPCSRATVTELGQLMATHAKDLKVQVEVFAPRSMSKTWATGGLYQAAKSIPGVEVRLDEDGKMGRSLGVQTSGQAMLYSTTGKLAFSGGITASRGHEGDNDGMDAIDSYLRTGRIAKPTTPVFGCSFGYTSVGADK